MYLEKEFRRTISEKNMEKKKLYENVFTIFDKHFYIRNSQCYIIFCIIVLLLCYNII